MEVTVVFEVSDAHPNYGVAENNTKAIRLTGSGLPKNTDLTMWVPLDLDVENGDLLVLSGSFHKPENQ